MPVSATIPVTQDYREVTLALGEADNLTSICLSPGYILGVTDEVPAKLVRINRDNFNDRSVLTFANDDEHKNGADVMHVGAAVGGGIYVMFRNGPPNTLMISKVDFTTTPMTYTDWWREEDYAAGYGTMTTDDVYVYALIGPYPNAYIARMKLSDQTAVITQIPGVTFGRNLRISGSPAKLYAVGQTDPPDDGLMWVKRIDATSLGVEDSTTIAGGNTTVIPNNIGVELQPKDFIWVGSRAFTGTLKRIRKSNLSDVTTVSTAITPSTSSGCRAVEDDNPFVWALFDNGKAVRINTDSATLEQRTYALTGGFHYRIVSGDPFLYGSFYSAPTKIVRYRIPDDVAPGSLAWSRFIFGTLSGVIGARAQVSSVVTDSEGNIIALGTFTNGEVNFCGTPTSGTRTDCSTTKTTAGTDVFLAKYNSARTLMWVKTFQTTNPQFLYVAVDGSDNIFITGAFYNGINLGGGDLPYTGLGSFSNMFVGWFTPGSQGIEGTHLFSRSVGSSLGSTRPNGIAVDSAGMIVLTGSHARNTDFGGGIRSLGSFIVKYSSANVWQWDKIFAATPTAITVDSTTAIILAGQGPVDLGGGAIDNPNSAWIAKFTPGSLGVPGAHVWSRPVATSGAAFVNGVAVDGLSRVVAVGSFGGTVNFGGGDTSTSQGATGAYIAIFDSSSNYVDDLKLGGMNVGALGSETAFGVQADSASNIAIFGRATGSVDWGDGNPDLGTGNANTFIAHYSQGLTYRWHKRYLGSANITASGIACNEFNATLVGTFIGSFNFGDGNWDSPITSDGILLQFKS